MNSKRTSALAPTPNRYFCLAALLTLCCHFFVPLARAVDLHACFGWVGFAAVCVGVLIISRANAALLAAETSAKPFEVARVLVKSGPFRFSRNPIYLGMAIILLGGALALGSLFLILFPLAFVAVIELTIIRDEEKGLAMRFGARYIDYKNKVRRWI